MDFNTYMKKVKLHFLRKPNSGFLSTLLYNFKVNPTTDIKTIDHQLETMEINVNPQWLMSQDVKVSAGCIAEQLYHIGLLHQYRMGNRDKARYQRAADQAARHLVKQTGFDLPKESLQELRDEFRHKSTEEIYEMMESDEQQNPKDDPLASDLNCTLKTQNQGSKNKVHQAIQRAHMAQRLVGKAVDTVSPEFQQVFDEITGGKLDWLTILQNYLNEKTIGELDFTQFDRRMLPYELYLPWNQSNLKINKIVIAFDVSGSVSKEQIAYFLQEIKAIKLQLNPKTIDVITFNTDIVDVFTIAEQESFAKVAIDIGGGTDLVPVFDYYKGREQPEFLILFSDLHVDRIPLEDKPKYETIWLCIDNPDATVNFGKLIHINTNNL